MKLKFILRHMFLCSISEQIVEYHLLIPAVMAFKKSTGALLLNLSIFWPLVNYFCRVFADLVQPGNMLSSPLPRKVATASLFPRCIALKLC